jgi:hypothetical protein
MSGRSAAKAPAIAPATWCAQARPVKEPIPAPADKWAVPVKLPPPKKRKTQHVLRFRSSLQKLERLPSIFPEAFDAYPRAKPRLFS